MIIFPLLILYVMIEDHFNEEQLFGVGGTGGQEPRRIGGGRSTGGGREKGGKGEI